MGKAESKGQRNRRVLLYGLVAAFLAFLCGVVFFSRATFAADDHSNDIALTREFLAAHDEGDVYLLPTGNYYLASSVSVGKTIELEADATVSLCLNGYSLTFGGTATDAQYRYPVIRAVDASLTVSDCSENETGKIDGNGVSGSVIYVERGDFSLTGGGITGGRGTIRFDPYQNCVEVDNENLQPEEQRVGYGYGEEGFYIQGGGVFALDSDFSMTGGAIYGNGVAAASARWYGETVTKYDRENIADPGKTPVYEGAIIEGGDHQVFNSGDNVTISRAQGGGVFIGTTYENRSNEYKSTFVMSGGAIANNVSYLHGAGIFIHNVDFEMRGGVVGGERQYLERYTTGGASIAFDHGGNTAAAGLDGLGSTQGGGVYIYRGNARGDGNDVKFTGTAEISYNEASSSSALVVGEGSTVEISGSVRIIHNTASAGATISASGNANYATAFTMTGGTIEENRANGAHLSVTNASDIQILGGYIRNNSGGEEGSSEEAGKTGNIVSLSTLAGNGGSITVKGLTVTGNRIYGSAQFAVTGNSGTVNIEDLVFTDNEGLRYYNSNGVLTGGSGGVSVQKAMSLKMRNVVISDNISSLNYSGLYLTGISKGTYLIENSEITDNAAHSNYAGVYLAAANNSTEAGGTFTFQNVTISGNRAGTGAPTTSYSGLAAAASNHGIEVVLNGVSVDNNSAPTSYSGIYLGYNVVATMTGGSISGNTSGVYGSAEEAGRSGSGSGLYLAEAHNDANFKRNGAVMTANGVTISDNISTASGAGIYIGRGAVKADGTVLDGAKLTMTDSSIIGNAATGYWKANKTLGEAHGGGVYVAGGLTSNKVHFGTFSMTGGSISGNTAMQHGGGIYSYYGDVTLENVAVTNNRAGRMSGINPQTGAGNSAYGGGIYAAAHNSADREIGLSITGGSISGNTATYAGGGVYVNGGTNKRMQVSISGTVISGNEATSYRNTEAETLHESSGLGGGIYLQNLADAEFGGIAVRYNTAYYRGGGVYLASTATIVISGVTVVADNANTVSGAKVADNLRLTAGTGLVRISKSGLKEGSRIYVYGSKDFIAADNASGASVKDYFFSDVATLEVQQTDEVSFDLKLVTGTSEPVVVPDNPAKTVTVTLTVTDTGGVPSVGGILQGETAVYFDGEDESALTATYRVTIREGYYFSAVVFNDSKYYFDSYTGRLYVSVNGGPSAEYKGEFFKEESGALTFSITLKPDRENALTLMVEEIGEPFAMNADSELFYTGSAHEVAIDRTQSGTSGDFSYLSSFVRTTDTQYMVNGSWGTEAPVDAGSYAVRVVWDASPYVGGISYSGNAWILVIGAQEWSDETADHIEITLDKDEFTYDPDQLPQPSATVRDTVRGINLLQNTDYVVTVSNNAAAGTGVVTITGIGNYDGVLTKSFVINKIVNALNYSGETTFSRTYNGSAQNISLSGLSAGYGAIVFETEGDCEVNAELDGSYTFSARNAGEYKVIFRSYGDNNYESCEQVISVTISKAPVTITASDKVQTFNPESAQQTVALDAQVSAGAALSEVLVSGGGSYSASSGNITLPGAGTYEVTLRVAETQNYESAEAGFSIEIRPYEVAKPARDNTVYTYDGTEKTYLLATSNYYTVSGRTTMRDAGTETIVVTLKSTDYCWADGTSGAATYTFTVNRAQNNINTAAVQTRLTYNGTDQPISLAGVLATDGVDRLTVSVSNNGAYDAAAGSVILRNAGTYTISLSIGESANYLPASATVTVTVDPKSVERPAADPSSFIYTGTVQTYTIAAGADYTISGELSRTNAGETTITVSLKDTNNTRWSDGSTADLLYAFNIEKANPSYSVPSGLTAQAGAKLSTIALPEGWSWNNPNIEVGSGTTAYNATYIPSDTQNYNTVTIALTVRVAGEPAADTFILASESSIVVFAVLDAVLIAGVTALLIIRRRKNKRS